MPLPFQGTTIGALNTYAGHPQAFDEHDVVLAEEVVAWVAVAVGNAEAATAAATISLSCTTMTSRTFIEKAKHLDGAHKISEDEAFTMLIRASQRTNTKLRDMAAELVRTGILHSRSDSANPSRFHHDSAIHRACDGPTAIEVTIQYGVV